MRVRSCSYCGRLREPAAMTRRSLAVLGALAIVVVAAGCGGRRAGTVERPNVLVILIDALRADHLGCYGYPQETTPVIDAVAAGGVVFEHALSPASWTKPSVPSLFTGLTPVAHGVVAGNKRDRPGRITSDVLAPELVTIAEVFQAGDYETRAFVNNVHLSGFMGFAQGFDVYADGLGDAADITDRVLGWLGDRTHERPFFAYVHCLDPHWSYDPPTSFEKLYPPPDDVTIDFDRASWSELENRVEEGGEGFTADDLEAMQGLYDAEIRFTDAAIGQLLAKLEALDLERETIILITADHGEEFLEHGRIGHGSNVYDTVLRIPLILRVPGVDGPRRIDEPVQLIDVMPTLLDLAGLETPEGVQGLSLAGALAGEELPERPAFADHRPNGDWGRWQQGVRNGRYKLIRTFELPGRMAPSPQRWLPVGLRTGAWVEAEFEVDGDDLMVTELEPLEARDVISLTGPIAAVDVDRTAIDILGVRCRLDADTEVRDGKKRPANPAVLVTETWVKVKGQLVDGRIESNTVTTLAAEDDHELEIKAPVAAIEQTRPDEVALSFGVLEAEVDNDDTDFEGDWMAFGGWPTAAESDGPALPGLSPAELLAVRTLAAVELYDLVADPGEQQDIAREHPEVVAMLTGLLDQWEVESFAARPAGGTLTLDPESIRQLKALGYLQ